MGCLHSKGGSKEQRDYAPLEQNNPNKRPNDNDNLTSKVSGQGNGRKNTETSGTNMNGNQRPSKKQGQPQDTDPSQIQEIDSNPVQSELYLPSQPVFGEPEEPEDLANADYVRKLPPNIQSIVKVLFAAFEKFPVDKMENIVLTIGNTGSGKSTLLTALIRGALNMEIRTLRNKRMIRGKERTEILNVIDVKEEFRGDVLKIGHLKAQSETFLPTWFIDELSKITYTDVAGRNDTRGELMEIINLLLIKKVFNMAKKVRLLVIFPKGEIDNARGGVVREQMEIVLKIIQGNYEDMIDAIVPIITKVKPTERGSEDEELFSIDDQRQNMQEVFEQWLDNYVKEKNLTQSRIDFINNLEHNQDGSTRLRDVQFIDFSSLPDFEDNAAMDAEMMPQYVEYYQLRRFLHAVAKKTIAVDPLDRPLWAEDTSDKRQDPEGYEETRYVDHGTKIDDAKQILQELEPADGRKFSAPLDEQRYDRLIKFFENDLARVAKKLNDRVDEIVAQENAISLLQGLDIDNEPCLAQFSSYIGFFKTHNLLDCVNDYANKLKQEVDMVKQRVDDHIRQEKINNISQSVIDLINDIHARYFKQSFVSVVNKMIEMVDNIELFESKEAKTPDQERNLREAKKRGYGYIRQLMNNQIVTNNALLLIFAYHLRAADNDQDKYTLLFFDMVQPASMNPLLRDIILSNKWNKDKKVHEWKSLDRYKLMCGPDFKFVMKYKDGWPYAILDDKPDQEIVPDTNQHMMSWLNRINDVGSVFNRSYNQKKCDGFEQVNFILTQQGIELQFENGKFAVNKDLGINSKDQGSFLNQGFTNTIWVKQGHSKYNDSTCSSFILNFANPNVENNKQTTFFIERRKGELCPRVIMGHKNPSYWTYLNFSRRDKDGYKDKAKGEFKLIKY